jgi:hypothetical protein
MAVSLSALRAGRASPPRNLPGTHFCWRLSRPQGHSAAGRIRSIEKIHLIGTRTRDLLVCSIVPQPTTLPRAPFVGKTNRKYIFSPVCTSPTHEVIMWTMRETGRTLYALEVTTATWALFTWTIWWPATTVFPGRLGNEKGLFSHLVDLTILNAHVRVHSAMNFFSPYLLTIRSHNL